MNLETAIKTALEYEQRIRDLYRDAVRQTDTPDGKKIFQALADDEQHHVDYLSSKLDEWQRSGQVTIDQLTSTIPDKETIRRQAETLKARLSEDARGLKQQMLSQALAMEIETSRFYRTLIDQVPSKVRSMFTRFMEIEDNHVEAVQFELDYLTKTGFWYGFEEFDMEQIG